MRRLATIALGLLAAVIPASAAWAHSGGVGGSGCGCHGSGTVGIDVTADAETIEQIGRAHV